MLYIHTQCSICHHLVIPETITLFTSPHHCIRHPYIDRLSTDRRWNITLILTQTPPKHVFSAYTYSRRTLVDVVVWHTLWRFPSPVRIAYKVIFFFRFSVTHKAFFDVCFIIFVYTFEGCKDGPETFWNISPSQCHSNTTTSID